MIGLICKVIYQNGGGLGVQIFRPGEARTWAGLHLNFPHLGVLWPQTLILQRQLEGQSTVSSVHYVAGWLRFSIEMKASQSWGLSRTENDSTHRPTTMIKDLKTKQHC